MEIPFYVVYGEEDHILSQGVYPTEEEAERRADELAHQYPGRTFCVLVPASEFTVPKDEEESRA